MISAGASEAISMSMGSLLNPGDNILTPSPGYPQYTALVGYFGLELKEYFLDEENGYKFLRGERFEVKKMINCEKHNFLIVKCGEDVLGSVAYAQEGFRNLLPKSRRIIESIY